MLLSSVLCHFSLNILSFAHYLDFVSFVSKHTCAKASQLENSSFIAAAFIIAHGRVTSTALCEICGPPTCFEVLLPTEL